MQDDPHGDRDWEHWPGRRTHDDGIRHRLRTLFTASDDAEDVEALIDRRGREIEAQTDQLQATIADLERREEQTARLRSAIEEKLRHGSAELDERHAELGDLALELRARDESLRAAEREVAKRTQELGAVELRRAALERREEALLEREKALERISAELTSRELELASGEQRLGQAGAQAPDRAGPSTAPARPAANAHVLFVARGAYQLVDRSGPPPRPGTVVELEGRSYGVERVGRSPLPGDDRVFAYVELVAASAPSPES